MRQMQLNQRKQLEQIRREKNQHTHKTKWLERRFHSILNSKYNLFPFEKESNFCWCSLLSKRTEDSSSLIRNFSCDIIKYFIYILMVKDCRYTCLVGRSVGCLEEYGVRWRSEKETNRCLSKRCDALSNALLLERPLNYKTCENAFHFQFIAALFFSSFVCTGPEYISIAVKSVRSHVGIQLRAARVFDCVLSKG